MSVEVFLSKEARKGCLRCSTRSECPFSLGPTFSSVKLGVYSEGAFFSSAGVYQELRVGQPTVPPVVGRVSMGNDAGAPQSLCTSLSSV